jgi:hypothetical protein
LSDYLVVARTYHNEVEARIAQAALDAEGIRSIVIPDNAGGMLPSMQLLFPTRLVVHEDDLDEARRLLDRPPVEDAEAAAEEVDDAESDDDDDDANV